MKKGLNETKLIGNVGAEDARLSHTPQGTAVLNFSLAVNDTYKEKETTEWFKVAVFGKRAEGLAPYVKSGIPLFVSGRVGVSKPWESKDGGWKADLTLVVGNGNDDFIFLPSNIGRDEEIPDVPTESDTGFPYPTD